jgi:quercetin dioxygenase-like cupin family protein
MRMSKAGDIFENPVTGERAIVRIGTEQTSGELLVADLYIRPGGAVMGEHYHPSAEERFTVLRGQIGVRLSGQTSYAKPGVILTVPAGVPHDWWNASNDEAVVRVEIRPAARFEMMIRNAFGLAQDGKVNRRGMPNPLQLALFAREFADVVRFTWPAPAMQRALFNLLTPLAILLGYRGSYLRYMKRGPSGFVPVEPLDALFTGAWGSDRTVTKVSLPVWHLAKNSVKRHGESFANDVLLHSPVCI